MRFAYLGSGSKGNAALVQAGNTTVMLDCGFSAREVLNRFELAGIDASTVSAIVVTHEHGDHISGVGAVARKLGIPVWITAGTARAASHKLGQVPSLYSFDPHTAFTIGEVEVQPFPVPHDAAEPAQFVFSDGTVRLGILTDTGCSTSHIEQSLSECDALAIECNHDSRMLQRGPYPPALKERVSGRLGHLSNHDAAALLERVAHPGLQHVVAVHLSETNNSPSLARTALAGALGVGSDRILVGDQDYGLDWCTIEH